MKILNKIKNIYLGVAIQYIIPSCLVYFGIKNLKLSSF